MRFSPSTHLLISNDLTQMVNFPPQIPDYDSHSSVLLDIFVSSDANICSTIAFPPLGNSDRDVVSVPIDFPSYSQQDALFHRISYDYCCADLNGLRDHWEDIFKVSGSAADSEFCEWVHVGIDVFISHQKYQFKPHTSPCFSAACAAAVVYRNHLLNLK